MERIPVGSKEFVIVDIKDRLGTLSSLDGLGLKYDIVESKTGTKKVDQGNANNQGMRVYCLADTTSWAPGEYKVYVNFTLAPEIPKVGPVLFTVDAL